MFDGSKLLREIAINFELIATFPSKKVTSLLTNSVESAENLDTDYNRNVISRLNLIFFPSRESFF
jgi:hypothetical protein